MKTYELVNEWKLNLENGKCVFNENSEAYTNERFAEGDTVSVILNTKGDIIFCKNHNTLGTAYKAIHPTHSIFPIAYLRDKGDSIEILP